MVAQRVKFRCVHCNRLLSAPVNHIGRAIACPKCVQAVTVPMLGAGAELKADPESPSKPSREAVGAGISSGAAQKIRDDIPPFMTEIAAAIPDEVLAIQPEDIRAEVPELGINLAPADRLELPIETVRSEEDSTLPADLGEISETGAPAREVVRAESWFTRPETISDRDRPEPVLPPPIEVEPASTLAIDSDSPRRRAGEVTLPASVVLAWSMFVLFAQALSFVAGLMVGHYYWKHL